VFAQDDQVDTELVTLMAINQDFEIQPHEKSHRVTAHVSGFGEGRKLVSVSPHMHFRGKSFKAWVQHEPSNDSDQKDSDEAEDELIIKVPNYDFNWQHAYQFNEKRKLDDVESIRVEVEFDNSAENPFNPDPRSSAERLPSILPRRVTIDYLNKQQRERLDQFVVKYFDRFDLNRDGQIVESELPRIKRSEARNFDEDSDGAVTPKELTGAIWNRFR